MDQVRELYIVKELSLREVGQVVGMSAPQLRRRMAAAGIPRREPSCNPTPQGKQPVSPEEAEAIKAAVAAAGEDVTIDELAARLGRSQTTIRRIAGWSEHRQSRSLTGNEEAQLKELHAAGLRGVQIARILGRSQGIIYTAQRHLGLPPDRPDPDHATVVALYGKLGSYAAVSEAARPQVPPKRIKVILESEGITPREHPPHRRAPQPPHPLDPHLAEIGRLWLHTGILLSELADLYEVEYHVMHGFLKSRKLFRTTGSSARVSAGMHQQILDLTAVGWSSGDISAELGISQVSVNRHRRIEPQRFGRRQPVRRGPA